MWSSTVFKQLTFYLVSPFFFKYHIAEFVEPYFCLYTGATIVELFLEQQALGADLNITRDFCTAMQNGDL